MKRLTLLTILLVVVGLTAGFAIDVKPTFSLSGSATAKWGYNLLDGTNGFNNTADASFTMTLLPEDGTESKGADAPWYGSISFDNVEFFWTDAVSEEATGFVAGPVDGDISAKIVGMGGNLEIGIYGAPSLKYEYASFVPLFSEDEGYDPTSNIIPKISIKGGLSVLYKMASIGSFTVKFASIGDWGVTAADTTTERTVVFGDGTTDPTADATIVYYENDGTTVTLDNPLVDGKLYVKAVTTTTAYSGDTQYAFGADFSLTAVKDLTFAVGAIYDLATSYLGFGAKAGYTVSGITIKAAIDGVSDGALSYDIAGSIGYKFMKDKDSVSLDAYYDSASQLDLGLLFKDAEGFVPGLSITLGAYGNDLLGAQTMSFAESISYKYMMGDVNYVKPYEKLVYDLDTPAMYLNVGLETKLIPNTVFKIDFAGGKKADDNNAGLVKTDIAAYQVLSVSATVSY